MANLKFRVTAARDGWEVINPVTEKVELTAILPDDEVTLRHLLLVGHKSTLCDGGATDKGTTLAQRIKMMSDRQRSIIDGTWGFRDGRGGKASKFPDRLLFEACVALGHLKGDAVTRELWAKSTDVSRSKAYAKEGVMQWLQEHSADAPDTDELWG